jgi:CRP-like cAMP-binding protein
MSPLRFEPLPPLPAVTLARKLKESPIFRYASVDELFRISAISRQVRYARSTTVQERGVPAEYIQFLLSGKLQLVDGTTEERIVEPPAILGFQEVLRGTALQERASAAVDSIALVMPAEEFRTLLAANIELAQGLFRMILDPRTATAAPSKLARSASFRYEGNGAPLRTVEKALYLQTIPIFGRATAEEI